MYTSPLGDVHMQLEPQKVEAQPLLADCGTRYGVFEALLLLCWFVFEHVEVDPLNAGLLSTHYRHGSVKHSRGKNSMESNIYYFTLQFIFKETK